MATLKPKHILIAPLDWGLGHTARCIPLISYIQSLGHIPVVACNSSQRSFIEETFGGITIINLEGYNITYSQWNKWGQMGLLSQLPGIINAINREHKWLQKLAEKMQIDGIISDNRYGLFHARIPSVILTHQLRVRSGFWNVADRLVQKIHYKYLERFNATWVVDAPGDTNLGGKLSHTVPLPRHTKYIGLLSRFAGVAEPGETNGSLLVLLSGPEPQRSILSRMLWRQALRYNGKVIFIEGSDTTVPPTEIPPHIAYYNRMGCDQLTPFLKGAGMVVCRSGYSTLMDLVTLQKKAILIPTPGQTEQEYLGKRLHEEGVFYCTKQIGFDLARAMNESRDFPFKTLELSSAFSSYQNIVGEWLGGL